MTEYELDLVKLAFEHQIRIAAPGLSENMQHTIVITALRRIRQQLNIPAPTVLHTPHEQDMKP